VRSISIVMATFNGAEFLRSQLDSLAFQTLLPIELIISDDHSTDETLQIATSFSKCAPFPVRIYENDSRVGYRANFMRAAALAKGELVAFCDQDDVWMPEKLERCGEAFEPVDRGSGGHQCWLRLPRAGHEAHASEAEKHGTENDRAPMLSNVECEPLNLRDYDLRIG